MAEIVKLAILELEGNCRTEVVRVRLEIGPEDARPTVQVRGALPPNPELMATLEQWRDRYHSLGQPNRTIKPQTILYDGSIYIDNCHRTAQLLKQQFQAWLGTPPFRIIDEQLREELNRHELIRILIRTEHSELQWLPWHSWSFIDRYRRAEIGLSSLATLQSVQDPKSHHRQVRVLAILGHSSGIETEEDARLLQTLPGAKVEILLQPERSQISHQLWDQSWNILFFAGHSKTENSKGRICLNPQESLSLEELKYGLQRAIANGLQLAIFNSCDGLGLAYELDEVGLPYMIVMREPIPDPVAQSFLKGFLNAFSQGQSLFEATREARERLEGVEGKYPCASWLPIVYQNPSMPMLYWHTLQGKVDSVLQKTPSPQPVLESIPTAPRQKNKILPIFIALVVTCLTITLRMLGFLEPLELRAYDHLLSMRSGLVQSNNRAFAVLIDEEDIKYQRKLGIKGEGSLSDEALMRLLNIIEPYHPRVIGLDIIHDFPFQKNIEDYLESHTNFFGICEIGAAEYGISDTEPPINLSPDQIGFMSFPLDKGNFIRRQFLGMTPGDSCRTDRSLSFQMALKYLEGESSDSNSVSYSFSDDGLLELKLEHSQRVYKSIESNSGGYRLSETATRGFQTLINYHHSHVPSSQLRTILELKSSEKERFRDLIENKMVFIGIDIPNVDQYKTPLNATSNLTTPGVLIHAQMANSILEAPLDGLAPISWWPEIIENFWVFLWSVLGAAILFITVSRGVRQVLLLIATLSLYGVCFYALFKSFWIPLIPALFGLIASYFFSSKFAAKGK